MIMEYNHPTNTMSRNPQTYTFGDDASSSPIRPGRKYRRARGYTPPGRKSAAATGNRSAAAANGRNTGAAPSKATSYRQGGQTNNSPATARSPQSSLAGQRHHPQQQPQAQANYAFSTGDAWDTPPAKGNNNNDDGSLAYSASSSVQSVESSNDSSFCEILKVIDSDDIKEHGDPELKDFIAKQSKAANDSAKAGHAQRGKARGKGMDAMANNTNNASNDAAVAGWRQRNHAQMQQPQQQRKKQQHYSMAKQQHHQPSNPVDWNYSKDSSEDDVFGVDFNEYEENILDTIAGKRDKDNVVAHRVTVTSQAPARNNNFTNNDAFFSDDPFASNNSPYDSAPASPRVDYRAASSSGHVTPPPNSRHRRTSTPPGSAQSISRTISRHSGSSSDGSLDTPTASSPHSNGGGPVNIHSSKPPQARSMSAANLTRRKSDREGKQVVTEDSLSEAFYAKSWMCGFTDAFNFDGFDTFHK